MTVLRNSLPVRNRYAWESAPLHNFLNFDRLSLGIHGVDMSDGVGGLTGVISLGDRCPRFVMLGTNFSQQVLFHGSVCFCIWRGAQSVYFH